MKSFAQTFTKVYYIIQEKLIIIKNNVKASIPKTKRVYTHIYELFFINKWEERAFVAGYD